MDRHLTRFNNDFDSPKVRQHVTNPGNWPLNSAPGRRWWQRSEITNPKTQIPRKSKTSKSQKATGARFGSLATCILEVCLGFGASAPPRRSGGTTAAHFFRVHSTNNSARKVESDPDIFFHCQHCKAALVANRSAAGMNLACQKCGQQTLVPQPQEPDSSASAYTEELRGKLKENESQRAEITGYINQLTIQLHRWQLRLQTLDERKAQIEKDLAGK